MLCPLVDEIQSKIIHMGFFISNSVVNTELYRKKWKENENFSTIINFCLLLLIHLIKVDYVTTSSGSTTNITSLPTLFGILCVLPPLILFGHMHLSNFLLVVCILHLPSAPLVFLATINILS
jgi:hypothetical protein